MLSINTNLSSLIAQHSLTNSTVLLNQAIERMTTGFKINSAKDNAANYSISTSLSSRLSSYGVAEDNVAMGLDMLMTAEESLTLVSDHVSRIRDLAEQAANGTYGAASLSAIQAEVTARLNEAARIVSNTEYNGIKLFSPEEGVSGGDPDTPDVSNTNFMEEVDRLSETEAIAQGYTIIKTADELQNIWNDLNGKYILMNDIDLSGYEWDPIGGYASPSFTGELNGNGYAIKNLSTYNPRNVTSPTEGFFGSLSGSVSNLGLENILIENYHETGGICAILDGTITNCYVTGQIIKDVTRSRAGVPVAGNGSVGGLVGRMDSGSITSCYAAVKIEDTSRSDDGAFIGRMEDGTMQNSMYYSSVNPGMPGIGQIAGGDASGLTDGVTPPSINSLLNTVDNIYTRTPEASIMEIVFQAGIYSTPSSQITIDLGFDYSLDVDVSSSEAARNSLAAIDEVLAKISEKQTEYGSAYNRLESALESIGVSIENLSSTQSTIRDADIAEVSSEYIRQQILQQASATLLATANQSPLIALQLI